MKYEKIVKKITDDDVLKLQKKLEKDFFGALPDYEGQPYGINTSIGQSFNGEGLKMIDESQTMRCDKQKVRCDAYDINSAYPFALENFEYPLSNECDWVEGKDIKSNEEWQKGCNLLFIEIDTKNIKNKFNKSYDVYKKRFFVDGKGKEIGKGWITNIGLMNMGKIYDIKPVNIIAMLKFTDLGKLPKKACNVLKKFKGVKDEYKKKYGAESRKYKEIKVVYNKFCYGKLAQRYGTWRDKRCIIATFQNNYIMSYMIDTIEQCNIEDVVYVNTDGIILKAGSKFPGKVGNELGEFKKEFENKGVTFVRMNGYFVYNDDGTLMKQVYKLNRKMTEEEHKRYLNLEVVQFSKQRKVNGKWVTLSASLEEDVTNFMKVEV